MELTGKPDHKKMSIKHVYSSFCENFILSNDGKYSIINALMNLIIETIPSVVTVVLVVIFRAEDGANFSVRIEGPDVNNRETTDVANETVSLAGVEHRSEFELSVTVSKQLIQALHLKTEGIHYIVLREGDKVIHKEPFGVFLAKKGKKG
jgi:hypothetical protein